MNNKTIIEFGSSAVLFLQPMNLIPRNWQPAKLHINHLRCLTFGSLFSSKCRVYSLRPPYFRRVGSLL